MIDAESNPLLKACISTLKETSKDDSNNEFMTNCSLQVVDFDSAKSRYVEDLETKPKDTPASVDALYSDPSGISTLIEFKNGNLSGSKHREIHRKVRDSLLMLGDIAKLHIGDTRAFMDFVLVYNEQKNLAGTETANPATKVQESCSRVKIAKHFAEKGRSEYIRFGLDTFKGYCFRNVHTYTVREFESKFLAKIEHGERKAKSSF